MKRRSVHSSARPIEFLPNRFYFVVARETESCTLLPRLQSASNRTPAKPSSPSSIVWNVPRTAGIPFLSLDEYLPPISTYRDKDWDLDLVHTRRFIEFLSTLHVNTYKSETLTTDSSQPKHSGRTRVHYFYVRRRYLEQEVQAIHLLCRWRLLALHLSPQEAIAPFEHLPFLFSSFYPFSKEGYDPINLLESLMGIAKGREKQFIPIDTLGIPEAPDSMEGKELVWIISKHFCIFRDEQLDATIVERDSDSLPPGEAQSVPSTSSVEKVVPLLKQHDVSLVVSLYNQRFDSAMLSAHSIDYIDLTSSSAAAPVNSNTKTGFNEALVMRFIDVCENTAGVVAVHAPTASSRKSGRVVVGIGCYMMKHFQFTAKEALGWIRFCRPGSLSSAHQLFLYHMQPRMWRDGEKYRQKQQHAAMDSTLAESMQINIGQISLARESLLGTKDRRHHSHERSEEIQTSRESRLLPQLYPLQQPSTSAYMKRRPFTQGSQLGRRLHRGSDGARVVDFATMHKFLHQATSPAAGRSLEVTTAPDSTTSGSTKSSRQPEG